MKELQSAVRQYQHNDCSGLVMGYDEAETNRVVSELLRERNELAAQVERLRWCAESAIGWIDSVPSDTELPAMPGFDRDEFDSVMEETPAQSLEAVKREWKAELIEHCYMFSFLIDDRATEQSVDMSVIEDFEP